MIWKVFCGILSLLLITLIIRFYFTSNKEAKKGYLQIAFDSPQNSFQLIRYMGYAPSGGADIGECLYVTEKIQEGDMQSWHDEWSNAANRLVSFSENALANNHKQSAKEALFRSSTYFLASESCLPRGEERLKVFEKARDCFVKASLLDQKPFRQIQIPYENTTLPGFLYLADTSTPAKTIIINSGYDASAEELYFNSGFFAQKRGYNVLIFEGPGQGLPLRKQNLSFRPDWEKVIRAVVDFTVSLKEVNANQIALYGQSFGGYLTPKAAAYEKRISALIVNSPIISFVTLMENQGLPAKLAKEHPSTFNKIMSFEMKKSPKIDSLVKDGMWKIGGTTPSEWVENVEKYTLQNEPELITCPTLVIDSEEDGVTDRNQAEIFFNRLRCPKKMVLFTKETGAGLHCQVGACLYTNEVIFDWLDEVFK